jgi:hypothetical protein
MSEAKIIGISKATGRKPVVKSTGYETQRVPVWRYLLDNGNVVLLSRDRYPDPNSSDALEVVRCTP